MCEHFFSTCKRYNELMAARTESTLRKRRRMLLSVISAVSIINDLACNQKVWSYSVANVLNVDGRCISNRSLSSGTPIEALKHKLLWEPFPIATKTVLMRKRHGFHRPWTFYHISYPLCRCICRCRVDVYTHLPSEIRDRCCRYNSHEKT